MAYTYQEQWDRQLNPALNIPSKQQIIPIEEQRRLAKLQEVEDDLNYRTALMQQGMVDGELKGVATPAERYDIASAMEDAQRRASAPRIQSWGLNGPMITGNESEFMPSAPQPNPVIFGDYGKRSAIQQAQMSGRSIPEFSSGPASMMYGQQPQQGFKIPAGLRTSAGLDTAFELQKRQQLQADLDRKFQEDVRQFGLNYANNQRTLAMQEMTQRRAQELQPMEVAQKRMALDNAALLSDRQKQTLDRVDAQDRAIQAFRDIEIGLSGDNTEKALNGIRQFNPNVTDIQKDAQGNIILNQPGKQPKVITPNEFRQMKAQFMPEEQKNLREEAALTTKEKIAETRAKAAANGKVLTPEQQEIADEKIKKARREEAKSLSNTIARKIAPAMRDDNNKPIANAYAGEVQAYAEEAYNEYGDIISGQKELESVALGNIARNFGQSDAEIETLVKDQGLKVNPKQLKDAGEFLEKVELIKEIKSMLPQTSKATIDMMKKAPVDAVRNYLSSLK